MPPKFLRFDPEQQERVSSTYRDLLEDPRTQGMERKHIQKLATRMAVKPDEYDLPKPMPKPAKERKRALKDVSEETKKKVQVLPPDADVEGEGILGDIADKVVKGAKKVLAWIAPKDMSAAVKKTMAKYSNEKIAQIRVCRVPIVSLIEKFLRAVAGKKIAPEHDKIFHLYMLIRLESGVVLRAERNQTFQLEPASQKNIDMKVSEELPENVKGPAAVNVSVPSMTLGEAMNAFVKEANARNPEMGPWRYASMSSGSAKSNNCQDMILSWLKGMKALTPGVEKFVKQDIDNLLPPVGNALQQAATDIAGAVNSALGKGKRLHTIDGGFEEVEEA